MTRARHARLLVRPTVRLASWRALPAAGALAVAMVHFFSAPPVIELRLAAIMLCVAAAFVLDDPAAHTLAASPTPLLLRRLLRTTLLLALLAALWMIVLWSAGEHIMTALTLELVTMLVVTLAAATVATPRIPDGRGGIAAAPALLIILSALLLLPATWTLFAHDPDDPAWQASHLRWALLLAIAVAAFLATSRDPANRHPPRLRLPGHRTR
jgi:fluoroquinolone transport system permease protein